MSKPLKPGEAGTADAGLEKSFAAALRAAEAAPDSRDAWEHVAELAARMQRPDEVAALYRKTLESNLPRDLRRIFAERAVQFHDEWFGDDPDKIADLLGRIIELDKSADWAVERLTVMLTSAGKWDKLLGVYDRLLATADEPHKRKRLLEDAAQVAKDFADDGDRAARYLGQLLVLDPDNEQLATSLERLLERQERWGDLIELWHSCLDRLSADEARELRLKIAEVWLDKKQEPQRALEVLRDLLDDSPGNARACAELERILAMERAPLDTRRASLSLLRQAYLVAEQADALIQALVRAIGFVESHEKPALHREVATRLGIAGRDLEAIGHYRELLVRDPNDADARRQIRRIAQRSNRFDLHADALAAAAAACEDGALKVAVLLEAAEVRHQRLGDAEGARALYRQVVESSDAEPQIALAAAHHLSELFDAAGQEGEQLAVLEKLAQLEPSAAVRRVVLGRAARLAEGLGETDRALACWQPVLTADPRDLEALAATAALLEQSERYQELVQVLRQRADAGVPATQRRADLGRVAEVLEQKLQQPQEAARTWLQIRTELGDDDATIAALDRLLSAGQRWAELAALLHDSVEERRQRASALVARLGAIHAALGDDAQMLHWYGQSIAIDPGSNEARVGLGSLLGGPHTATAARALATAYRATGDDQGLVALLEHRLAIAKDGRERTQALRETAEIHERAGDLPAAFQCIAKAIAATPDDLAIEAEVARLAESTGRLADAAEALRSAAATAALAVRKAELCKRAGRLHEERAGDNHAALVAYRAAAEADPHDTPALRAIARCAARGGDFELAADGALRAAHEQDRIDAELVAWLEAGAQSADSWRSLAAAVERPTAVRSPRMLRNSSR
jgi:hypothetical protein